MVAFQGQNPLRMTARVHLPLEKQQRGSTQGGRQPCDQRPRPQGPKEDTRPRGPTRHPLPVLKLLRALVWGRGVRDSCTEVTAMLGGDRDARR